MGFELLRSALALISQGAENNWWGLICPSHCRGPGVGGLLAAFLLGILVALGGVLQLVLLEEQFASASFEPSSYKAELSRSAQTC